MLVGLTLWAFMHLAGGMWHIDGDVLYARWLLPYLRYDQLTHAIGFGFAGLAVGEQFEPWMARGTRAASFTIVLLGGLAVGALNEMLEFLLTKAVSDTNIGGFENTGWDLVANTVGSLFAATWAAGRSPS